MFGDKPTKKDMDGSTGVAAIIFGAILFISCFPFSEWAQHHKVSGNFGGFLMLIAAAATMFGGPILFFWGIWKVRDAKFYREKYESMCANERRIKQAELERERKNRTESLIDETDDDEDEIDGDSTRNIFVKVYHLTSMDNIESIKKNGILSRAEIEKNNDYIDIAEHGALNNHRNILIDGISLDKFARCFFNPLPPMYHNRVKEGYEHLAIIELHIPIEKITRTYSGKTKVYHNLKIEGAKSSHLYKQSIASHMKDIKQLEVHNLNEIKWDPEKSAYLNNRNETIACRGAELLVYPKIPAKYIYEIHADMDMLEFELNSGFELGHPEIGDDEE